VKKSLGFASVYFSPIWIGKTRAQASFPRGFRSFSRLCPAKAVKRQNEK
jgi:hypothetical protein